MSVPVYSNDLEDGRDSVKRVDYKKEEDCSRYNNFGYVLSWGFENVLKKNKVV